MAGKFVLGVVVMVAQCLLPIKSILGHVEQACQYVVWTSMLLKPASSPARGPTASSPCKVGRARTRLLGGPWYS